MAVTVERRPIQRRVVKKEPMTREERMISSLSPDLNIMIRACQKAGRRMVRDFGEISHLQIMKKAPRDFVSSADLTSESIIMETLSEDRPDYGFISEEKGKIPPKNDCDMIWILDPIDGTANFIHAVPNFAISLALVKKDELVAGVIYNPISSELYYAEKGTGAFVMLPTGTERIRTSGRVKFDESFLEFTGLTTDHPYFTHAFADDFLSVRDFGSAALALARVAAGQTDVYVGRRLKIWDMAAGILIVREAGGVLFTESGDKDFASLRTSPMLFASSEKLSQSVKKRLNIEIK